MSDAEGEQSASKEPLYAYVDTNVLVEYRWLDEHDWPALLKSKSVVLVISQAMVDELQSLKDKPGLPRAKQQRAAERLKKLRSLVSPKPGENGVPTRVREGVGAVYARSASADVFSKYSLDRAQSDDVVLAVILEGREQQRAVCFVSNDEGARWRAEGHGIDTFDLPDEWRLKKEEVDPVEIENRKLREELQSLKNRQPKLSIYFAEDETRLHFEMPTPLGLELTEEYANYYKEFCNNLKSKLDPVQLVTVRTLGPGAVRQVDDYYLKIDGWFREIAALLPKMIEAHNLLDRCIELKLHVSNDGTAPAEDVELFLQASEGVRLLSERPQKPSLPSVPEAPTSTSFMKALLAMSVGTPTSPLGAFLTDGPPTWSIHSSQDSLGEHEASFTVGKLKHGMLRQLPPIYALISPYENAGSFNVRYEMHDDRLPAPVKGSVPRKFEYFDG